LHKLVVVCRVWKCEFSDAVRQSVAHDGIVGVLREAGAAAFDMTKAEAGFPSPTAQISDAGQLMWIMEIYSCSYIAYIQPYHPHLNAVPML
jgi:hypothetical protein